MKQTRTTQIIHIILCNAKVGERRKINKRVGFSKRKTIYFLMPKYVVGLKFSNRLNLRIDTTGYAQAIVVFLAIKRSASVRR